MATCRFVKEGFGHGPGILVRGVVGFVFLLEGIVKCRNNRCEGF